MAILPYILGACGSLGALGVTRCLVAPLRLGGRLTEDNGANGKEETEVIGVINVVFWSTAYISTLERDMIFRSEAYSFLRKIEIDDGKPFQYEKKIDLFYTMKDCVFLNKRSD